MSADYGLRTTDDRRPRTDYGLRITDDARLMTDDGRPTTDDGRRTADSKFWAADGGTLGIRAMKPRIRRLRGLAA